MSCCRLEADDGVSATGFAAMLMLRASGPGAPIFWLGPS
jgi:hypothetical protein